VTNIVKQEKDKVQSYNEKYRRYSEAYKALESWFKI